MENNIKKTLILSLNSVINSSSSLPIENPINIELPNGFWKEVIIEDGFVIVRVKQTYALTMLPTSFQILSSAGASDFLGDNLSATDSVGAFLIDQRTDTIFAGANDIFTYSFKLLSPIILKNLSGNFQISLVGRLINPSFPTTNELFSNRTYRNGLYYLNYQWNPGNDGYFSFYFKITLTK